MRFLLNYYKKNILTFIDLTYILTDRYGGGLVNLDAGKTALIFKAFCDENRVKILQSLSKEEKCACQLLEEINISQPTLSHHMKILCDAGIVVGRKEGKWMYYSFSESGVDQARACFDILTNRENKS